MNTNETLKRNDIHRPSVIDPTEYVMVGFECVKIENGDLGAMFFAREERAKITAHMARTGGTYSSHAHGGNCMVCGNANAVYTVLFHHPLTNVYVRMGDICAQKADMAFSSGDLDAFKAAARREAEAVAGKKKALKALTEAGMEAAWPIWTADYNTLPTTKRGFVEYQEETIRDIVSRLVKHGSISEKQMAFVGRLLAQIAERVATPAVPDAPVVEVPEGRYLVEGTVVSAKWQEGYMGGASILKILVKADAGYKVWGTCPEVLVPMYDSKENIKNTRVKFTATVTRKEPGFGIYSRPSVKQADVPEERKVEKGWGIGSVGVDPLPETEGAKFPSMEPGAKLYTEPVGV